MWFKKQADSMRAALQNASKPKYPEVGDVFRSISFGMDEKEFEQRMRKDEAVKVDSESHAWTSYHTDMFGSKFYINAKYIDGRLFKLTLGSELYGRYSAGEVLDLQKAVIGMFTEKYGKPTGNTISMRGVASTSTWDFGGKTIRVVLDDHAFKNDMALFIAITSTAMEAEQAAKIEAENVAKYSEYSANF